VTVTLNNINHPYPRDLDVLLVGPTGARTILMSDAGGPNLFNARTYTFDQSAGSDFPDDVTPANGSYKPFNYAGDVTIETGGIDNFPTSGPGSLNYGTANLNVFNNRNPNGTWSLYVVDDENVDSGSIAGGWTLNITSAFPTARVFDFDGDLKTDLSIFRPSNGQWWLNHSSDGIARVYTFGTSTDRIVPADYDGDGKTDVAFWRPSTGEWFVLRSSNLTFFAAPFGALGDVPAPGDFDSDGRADFTVFRPSNGVWYILQTSTGGITFTPFGAAGDVPVVGDYDGDGKSDVAIFRPNGATGAEWWMSRSTTGFFATVFGLSSDKPVVGDYTGDGKTDIAFWRPSTGEWYVLRSEDNSYYAAPFGAAGDIPVAGDYDGDSKTDLAVFRPSNTTWFVQRTTQGTLIQGFGLTGDIPTPSAFIP
jgi:subtilisin-like proprotein convertase family protein